MKNYIFKTGFNWSDNVCNGLLLESMLDVLESKHNAKIVNQTESRWYVSVNLSKFELFDMALSFGLDHKEALNRIEAVSV